MSIPYKAPEYNENAFNCPLCHAYAKQEWTQAVFNKTFDSRLHKAFCHSCGKNTYWLDKKMVFPDTGSFSNPNNDLGEEIISDYLEAAGISTKSPRGAAALLRLCIQKLCKQLGESGENINSDIGSLVSKGLNLQVQQMLDYVRVVGNEAVHPGQIDLKDNPAIVVVLAKLLNEIASEMITKPREIQELYNSLPQDKLKGIEARDKKK